MIVRSRTFDNWVAAVNRLLTNRFFKNVVTVGGGVAIAQLITFTFMPVLTRVYGPQSFGELAAFSALLSMIAPMATLGFAFAIVLPQSEDEVTALFRLSTLSATIIGIIAFIAVHFFQAEIAGRVGLQSSSHLLYLIPVSLVFTAILTIDNQLAIRRGHFRLKSTALVISKLLSNVGKVAGGLLLPSALILIAGDVTERVINSVILRGSIPDRRSCGVEGRPSLAGVWGALLKYKDFGLYRMPQRIIYAASLGLPVLALTKIFGSEVAGQYSVVVLLLGAPVMLLGGAFEEVFYPRVTRHIQSGAGSTRKLIMLYTKILGALGAPLFSVLGLFGDKIVPAALGEEWRQAGELSKWVALWMAAVLITRPAIASLPALRMQGILLIYEITITVARVLGLYLGSMHGGPIFAVALFSIINLVGYMALLALVLVKADAAAAAASAERPLGTGG